MFLNVEPKEIILSIKLVNSRLNINKSQPIGLKIIELLEISIEFLYLAK
jgi:hypothetical protein